MTCRRLQIFLLQWRLKKWLMRTVGEDESGARKNEFVAILDCCPLSLRLVSIVCRSGPGRIGGSAVVNRGSGAAGFSSQRGRGGPRSGRGRGGGRRGRGRGRDRDRGRGRSDGGSGGGGGRGKKPVEKSADELDKELDNYHAEAMQTS